MNNVMINLMISDFAKDIKKKIEGSKIYGIPVDIENIDHVIVSAYLQGQWEQMETVEKQRDIINTVFSI